MSAQELFEILPKQDTNQVDTYACASSTDQVSLSPLYHIFRALAVAAAAFSVVPSGRVRRYGQRLSRPVRALNFFFHVSAPLRGALFQIEVS